jgi:organic hydroperoxide reductase OsmC/OhrA
MPIQLASAGACFSMQLLRLCQTLQVQREADSRLEIDGGFN